MKKIEHFYLDTACVFGYSYHVATAEHEYFRDPVRSLDTIELSLIPGIDNTRQGWDKHFTAH